MNTTNILNFPEQVIRYIFRYISSKELWVTVRQLNKNFKKHVNDYLQCQGVFALTFGQTEVTRFIHIFKREGKYLETISSVPKSFPAREHIPHFAYYPYDCELYSLPTSLTDMDVPLLLEVCFSAVPDQKSSFRDDNIFVVTTYLYKFDTEKFSWQNVKATNHIVPGKVIACCPIGGSSMILVTDAYYLDDSKLHLIHLNMNSSSTNVNMATRFIPGYGKTRLDIPDQINTMDGYALIGVAKNTIILISPKLLWHGTLCIENRNCNVVWESNDMGQMGVRKNVHCFKLKENVYIFGGSYHGPWDYDLYCDKYNYEEKKFYANIHPLPPLLCTTTGSGVSLPFIGTDKNETFAVVVFAVEGKKDNIYMFTEKKGFVEANDNYIDIINIAKRTRMTKTSCSKGGAMTWVGN